MTTTDELVGTIAGQLVCDLLGAQQASGDDGVTAAIRISGFGRNEIPAIVARVDGYKLRPGLQPATIVVAARHDPPDISPEFLLQPGRTLTWHRDHLGEEGTVLIELGAQPDAEGLNTVFHLGDDEVLDTSDTERDGRLGLVAKLAWSASSDRELPEVLITELNAFYQALVAVTEGTPALRRWVSFVHQVAQGLAQLKRPIAQADVAAAIAEALHQLRLFPDDDLFADSGSANLRRRLRSNVRMSDLRKPNGSELRDEELRRLIRELVPIDRDGTPLETPEADELKSRMLLVVEGDSESRRRTRLWEWEQLFATAPSAVRGLGAAIREHLASRQSDRIDEYDELGVTAGLDARDRQAAIDFRAAEAPPDQDATLYGLLTAPLRQRVDKLASQSRRVSDPLVAILRELYDLSIEDTEPTEIGLSQSTNPDAAELSRHLFACLYAPTLIEIATTSIDGPGHTFTVDAALLARGAVSRDNDDEDEDDHGWDPLDMALTVGARTVAEFRWDPRSTGLITLARLIQEAGGRNRLSQVESLEALDEKVANPGWTLPLTPIVALDDHIDSWLERRTTDFENWTSDGLDIDSLHEHVDEYEQLLAHAHNHYVPAGAPSPVLDQLLDLDAATTNVGSILLPTNPIRLRWFANHLQRLRQSITSALDGEVTLNRENPDLYFDWLSRVSPHQQPPVLVAGPDSLLISSRERGLVEAYAPITRHDGGDASLVDDKSVDEMAGVTRRYLEEYPHKLDGLSVLILDAAGSVNLARSFVNAIDSPELTLQVHVMAPTASLQTIGDELARFDRARDSTSGLMPAYQVVLHPWDDPSDLGAFDELDGRIDLVLAPDLFGSDVKVDANTREQREHAAGASDPWLTPPTHPQDFGSADTGPTAVEQLLPPLPDPLLEHWSTLAVRRYRTQVVQEGGIDNTDYFSLRILFAQHVPLFERLHHVAHWVVTLDRFVGRDQIDAVEQRPDVILVREGVGKSELYTLTVSSNSGREFITERLTRKLGRDLGLVEDPAVAGRVAERLYDVGRNVVPGVMLRALGLGRTAEEIIGLVTARRRIADQFPLTDHGTVEAWLSLDDFPHWFGGSQRRRADLLRAIFTIHEDTVSVRLQVIESKFRQTDEIDVAREQVEITVRLLQDAFATPDTGERPADQPFWQRELVAALHQLPKRELDMADLPALSYLGDEPLTTALRVVIEALLSGRYQLESVDGIICATNSTDSGPDEHHELDNGQILVRTRRPGLLRILEAVRSSEPLGHERQAEAGEPGQPPSVAEPESNDPSDLVTSASATASGQPLPAPISGATPLTNLPPPVDDTEPTPAVPDSPSSIQPPKSDEPVVPPQPAPEAHDRPAHAETSDELEPDAATIGMSEHELDTLQQRALDAFASHGIGVTLPDIGPHQQGPGFYLLRFRPRPGVTTASIEARVADIKLALELTVDQDIRHYVDRGAVVFEVPKSPEQRFDVDAEQMWTDADWHEDALFAPIGRDITGSVVGINFSSSTTPHLLIAGTTGSGKSVALETILMGLCRQHEAASLRLHLIDPKGTELLRFEDDDHTEGEIGYDAEDAVEALSNMVDEMQDRYRRFKEISRVIQGGSVRSLQDYNNQVDEADQRLPWQVVVLDEYADLTADKDERKKVEEQLRRVAQKGRAAGIHVIVATQRPSADVITSVVRSNLPAQLALRVRTAIDSRIIIDQAGAEALAGYGDALFRTPAGVLRVQCGIVVP